MKMRSLPGDCRRNFLRDIHPLSSSHFFFLKSLEVMFMYLRKEVVAQGWSYRVLDINVNWLGSTSCQFICCFISWNVIMVWNQTELDGRSYFFQSFPILQSWLFPIPSWNHKYRQLYRIIFFFIGPDVPIKYVDVKWFGVEPWCHVKNHQVLTSTPITTTQPKIEECPKCLHVGLNGSKWSRICSAAWGVLLNAPLINNYGTLWILSDF